MHHEAGTGLGPDGGGAVVSGGHLDVDAAGPPALIGVLELRIGIVNTSVVVDGQAEFFSGAAPRGIGRSPAVPHPGGFATPGDGALQLVVEPDAPEGGGVSGQALLLPPAGPIDGGVVDDLGALDETGLELLSGVETLLDRDIAGGVRTRPVSVNTLNGCPFGPLAVDSCTSPSSIQWFTARRVVKGWPPKWVSARSRNETVR